MTPVFIRWFEDIGAGDTGSVGGKNASLGEMVRNLGCYDIKVPTGFATTAEGLPALSCGEQSWTGDRLESR